MKKTSFISFLKVIADRLLPTLFWVLLIFGFDTPCIAIITLTAAAVHELGHLIAIMISNVGSSMPEGRLNGFKIRLSECGYKQTFFILLSGPLANMVTALLLSLLSGASDYLSLVIIINVLTAISNLIPAKGCDGYGMIETVLLYKERSTAPLEALSFLITVLFTFLSLSMIGRVGVGYWIFSAYFVLLIKKLSDADGISKEKSDGKKY